MTDTPLPSLSDIDTTPTSLVEEDLNTPFSNPSLSADTLTNQDALTADTLNANPPTGNTPLSPNIFMDNSTPEPSPESDKDDKQKFVSKYIRRFTFASIITVINIVLIGLLFAYRTYITQVSQNGKNYQEIVTTTKKYLNLVTSYLGMNYEPTYKALHLLTPNDESNLQRIITTPQLSFAQKKDILKEKVTTLVSTIQNTMRETEETKKNIAKFGFLPEEIRTILAEENAISSIQRSLSSLEIIKFSTALNIFSYLDSVVGLIADALKMDKEKVANILDDLAARGERDVSAYVYMCYLNPFELNQDCASIGDFDLYYQDIMKDKDFDRGLFKNLMKYIDTLLENSDIPSFSILFHGFNAGSQSINFDIEINTTKQDEIKLLIKNNKIKNPHIFILTSLINLLKQSVFIVGSDINTKTIDITTRPITVGNTIYNVNTSSKSFDLPIQKSTEREIFDYMDTTTLSQLENAPSSGTLAAPASTLPTEYQEPSEETPSPAPEEPSVSEFTEEEPLPVPPSSNPLPTASTETEEPTPSETQLPAPSTETSTEIASEMPSEPEKSEEASAVAVPPAGEEAPMEFEEFVE